jgi:hypothetical protein
VKTTDLSSARWRKSSHSGGNSGQCVEVAKASGLVGVRDSKSPEGGHRVLDRDAASAMLAQVKAGDFDL